MKMRHRLAVENFIKEKITGVVHSHRTAPVVLIVVFSVVPF